MLVDGCLIHDFQDKGVSIADYSHGTIVSNTLIYKAGIGISTYAASNCVFVNNTIADSITGLLLRERTPGNGAGHAFATNNIVWGNVTNISLLNGAITFSDIDGSGVFPGIGNLNADPLFIASASGDYRLTAGSPGLNSGMDGVNMGPAFPVGGLSAPPVDLAALTLGTNGIRLTWRDDSDNEAAFLVERSLNSGPWLSIGSAPAGVTSYVDSAVPWDAFCRYRVRATNHAGLSRFSNLAGATLQSPIALVGGILTSNTVWSPALGTVLAVAPVIVPQNLTLTIEAGTQFRATNNGGIRVEGGGTLNVSGNEENRVVFMGGNGTNLWPGLSAIGSNALLAVRHAEIKGGPVGATNGATMLLEDCYIHDFKAGGWAIGACENAAAVTLRRCHFKFYHETLWRGSLMTIEECLFEYADNSSSDALDFDGVAAGSVIRRCTFRHGPQVNTDAIDLGPGLGKTSVGIVIQDTLMYDFPHDGGVSAGEGVWGLVVSNCLIYGCRGGIKAKETPGEPTNPTTMSVYQCTIVDNLVAGFSNCSTCLAGQITNSANNIVHGNPIDIVLLGQGVLTADHSVFGSTTYVGNGTFNQGEGVVVADPLFQDRAGRDYRLQPGSPGLGTGRNGTDMGCFYPVGAPMAASHPSIESINVHGGNNVIRFWADSEKSYTLQATETLQGGSWTALTNVSTRTVPTRIRFADPLPSIHRFYRLVTPQQP
jgi:parallel beta-helix repeat protein